MRLQITENCALLKDVDPMDLLQVEILVLEKIPRRFACFRYLPVNHEKVNGIPTMLTYINRLSSDFVHQRLWEGSLGCKVAKTGKVVIFWDHVMIWIYPPTQNAIFEHQDDIKFLGHLVGSRTFNLHFAGLLDLVF